MRTIISIIFVVIVVVVIIVIIVVVIVVIIILAILIRFVDVSPKIWQLVVFVRIMLFILHLLVLLGSSNHRVYLEANFFDELNRLLLLSLYNLWLRLFNLSYSFLSLGLILLLSGSRLL